MQSPELRSFLVACRSARKNAKNRNVKYLLTPEDIAEAWERCGGRCEVSGIKFDVSAMEDAYARRPFAPSLDRINSGGDYTADNVRVVCIAVNLAMNHWGESVLYAIVAAMLENGKIREVTRSTMSSVALPIDVRRYCNKKSITYSSRVRPYPGHPGIQLGGFPTLQEAIDARIDWARKNQCARVLEQVYQFTRDDSLLAEAARFPALAQSPNRLTECA